MKTRALGRTGLKLTEYGFGCAGLANLFVPVSRDAAMATLQTAWDGGMRYFDTAPYYGHGLSERRTGDFLQGQDRDSFILSTKVGKLLRPVPRDQVPDYGFVDPLPFAVNFDYSRDAILRSFEFSLARLGLNQIDVLLVHDLERAALKDSYDGHFRTFMVSGVKALDELKSAGVIGAWGLGSNEVSAILAIMRRVQIDALLLAGRYTLLDRTASAELMPLCQDQGVGVVIGGVFNSGILATGPGAGGHFDYGPPSDDIVARVNAMQAHAAAHGASLAGAALQFTLQHPAVTSVLIGSAKPSSLVRNFAQMRPELPDAIWAGFEPFVLS
jgi:D-threo-aldose 1-dehydrogenase